MIRLVTVIGHGTNLLPHFIKHYQKQVDEINIVVYKSDLYPNLDKDVEKIILNYPKVKITNVEYFRVFDWNMVTILYNKEKTKHVDDWWVVADIDEFQLYPFNNIRAMLSECDNNGWELIRGGFIDRVGENGEFPEILPDISLFKQFPNLGFFRYPMSDACPNKVCIMKGHVEITSGQHYAKINGNTTWGWQGWNNPLIAPYNKYSVQVHHFKWDKTCIDRIKSVADINEEYAWSREYQIMYDGLKKSNFKVDITNPQYMFEHNENPIYGDYKHWNKLITKIISI